MMAMWTRHNRKCKTNQRKADSKQIPQATHQKRSSSRSAGLAHSGDEAPLGQEKINTLLKHKKIKSNTLKKKEKRK
jgi:hypothetical protein